MFPTHLHDTDRLDMLRRQADEHRLARVFRRRRRTERLGEPCP